MLFWIKKLSPQAYAAKPISQGESFLYLFCCTLLDAAALIDGYYAGDNDSEDRSQIRYHLKELEREVGLILQCGRKCIGETEKQ